MNILNFLAQATPHVNPNATPYPTTSGGFDPTLFILATIGVIGIILLLGFFVTGFKNPFKKKGTGSGYVYKADPPSE